MAIIGLEVRQLDYPSRKCVFVLPPMYGLTLKWDVTKTGNGERGAWSGERKSGNELSAETSTKIQNGGPKNETEKEEDKERNLCLG